MQIRPLASDQQFALEQEVSGASSEKWPAQLLRSGIQASSGRLTTGGCAARNRCLVVGIATGGCTHELICLWGRPNQGPRSTHHQLPDRLRPLAAMASCNFLNWSAKFKLAGKCGWVNFELCKKNIVFNLKNEFKFCKLQKTIALSNCNTLY